MLFQNLYRATSFLITRTIEQRFPILFFITGQVTKGLSRWALHEKKLTMNWCPHVQQSPSKSGAGFPAFARGAAGRSLLCQTDQSSWRKQRGRGMCLENGALALDQAMDLASWCPPLPPAAVAVVGSVAFSPKSRRPKAPSASRSEWLYSCVCPIAHAVGASARNGSPSACIYPVNLTGIITRC